MVAVFTAAVEVDSTGVAASTAVVASVGAGFVEAAASTAVARFAVVAGSAEVIAVAASGARDPMVEAATEAVRSWAAGASHLVGPADSHAASMLLVADTEAAADTGLAMRSRTAIGIPSGALEAP